MNAPAIDFAAPDDATAIQRLLYGRPAENADTFQPPQQGWFMVARDDKGVGAFIVVRWDEQHGALVADQLEIEYRDGNPTMRGLRGGKALGDELMRRADEIGCWVYCPVAVGNSRHGAVLDELGFRVCSLLYGRPPGGQV
jgi:GNAT superfamily N-acetyltransferase